MSHATPNPPSASVPGALIAPTPAACAEHLAALDVDLSPMHEQAWLWAAPDTRPVRLVNAWDPSSPGLESVLNPMGQDTLDAPAAAGQELCVPGSAMGWRERVERALDAWVQRPVVWRVHDGVAQAVLLGALRYTWSAQAPQGLVERRDPLTGWAPTTLDAVRAFMGNLSTVVQGLQDLQASPANRPGLFWVQGVLKPYNLVPDLQRTLLDDALEQIARHAQRHRTRLQGWTTTGAVSWCPWPMARELDASAVDALLRRTKAGLRAFAHVLAGLDPFWRPLLRSLWRAQAQAQEQTTGETDPFGRLSERAFNLFEQVEPNERPIARTNLVHPPMVRDAWSVLDTVTRRWHDWKRTVAEHPRADLMLPWAVFHRMLPGQHTWRDDVWGAMTGAPSGTWKALRTAPRATVSALLRQPSGVLALALITALVPPGTPLPVNVLRQVPVEWWAEAQAQALAAGDAHPASSQQWATRRARAFLDAVRKRPWVDQQQPMLAWLDNAMVVMIWALHQPTVPFTDPSWTWATLEKRWLEQDGHAQQWPVPLQAGHLHGVTFSPVSSLPAWKMLGVALRNCLKNSLSDGHREEVMARRAVLLRLDGQGRSAVLLNYDPEQREWRCREHRASLNQAVNPLHNRVVKDLVALLNATTIDRGFLDATVQNHRMAAWSSSQAQVLRPLLGALNPSWGQAAPRPSWRRPCARLMFLLNDDAWWWRQRRRWFSRVAIACAVLFAWTALSGIIEGIDSVDDLASCGWGLLAVGTVAGVLTMGRRLIGSWP